MMNGVELDPKRFKKVSPQQAIHSKNLYRSICMPSMTQSYSLCIEYMKNWFLSKFNTDLFKTVYLDTKHVFDEVRTLSTLQILKKDRPSLAIVPTINWDFNNENLDLYPYGLSVYTQMGKFKNSFFRDPEHEVYLGIGMETFMMGFTYRMMVDTRAEQMDLYKFIKIAHRVNFTCGEDVDLDFHIPYPLMLQIARDTGFNIVESTDPNDYPKIENIPKFLRYLNMHSDIPFLYKHRTVNGKHEFFLRLQRMYIHVRPTELTADDGDRENNINTRYMLELTAEVRFPAPKMYAYYSETEHHLKELYTAWHQPDGKVSSFYTFKGTPIPDQNRYGWPLYLTTTYESDEKDLNKPLEIDFKELLEKEIGEIACDTIKMAISPSIFMDVIVYNGGQYMHGCVNWEDMVYRSDNPVTTIGSFIGLYIDMNYVNDQLIVKREMIDNRMMSHKTQKDEEGS